MDPTDYDVTRALTQPAEMLGAPADTSGAISNAIPF